MAKIVWTDTAVRQLLQIAAYIAQFDPAAATTIARRLRSAGESLAEFPDRGRPAGGGKRELPTIPPYVLRYRVDGDQVTILTIRHGRRRPL